MQKIKNQMAEKKYLIKRLNSLGFAFKGIFSLAKSESNAQIHLLATIIAMIASLLLKISFLEWCVIIFSITIVWTAETFNTAIEKIVDKLSPEYDDKAMFIKDISAGAVLISSIAALITGIIIFVPKLF
jgi:diacylglycerol kinase (ATP)